MNAKTEELKQLMLNQGDRWSQNPSYKEFKENAMKLVEDGADVLLLSDTPNLNLLEYLIHYSILGKDTGEIEVLLTKFPVLVNKVFHPRGIPPLERLMALTAVVDSPKVLQSRLKKFKQIAIILVDHGADLTVSLDFSRERNPYNAVTLLQFLILSNSNGVNDKEIKFLLAKKPNLISDSPGAPPSITALLRATLTGDNFINVEQYVCMPFKDFIHNIRLIMEYPQAVDSMFEHQGLEIIELFHLLVVKNRNGLSKDVLVALLKQDPGLINSLNAKGQSPLQSLMSAYNSGEINADEFREAVLFLVANNADIQTIDKTTLNAEGDVAPLLYLLILENKNGVNNEAIQKVLEKNPDLLIQQDSEGLTPLHRLLLKNKEYTIADIETILKLQDGAAVNAVNKQGQTLLHIAVKQDNAELVKLLIANHADINRQDNLGNTPAHIQETEGGSLQGLKALLENKPSLDIKNNDDQTAFDLCKDVLFKRVKIYIDQLRDYGLYTHGKGNKSAMIVELSNNLLKKLDELKTSDNYDKTLGEFTELLNSKDSEIKSVRFNWKTVKYNLMIGLSMIGLLFIAAKLVHSRITEGRARFFNQSSKTTSEMKLDSIKESLKDLKENNPSSPKPKN